MIKIEIRNHSVKEAMVKLSEINNDIPSNGELLSESIQDLFDLIKERNALPSWNTKDQAIDRCIELIGTLLEDLCPPSDEQIRKDNTHFGPEIRIVEGIKKYDGYMPERFSHQITMGARESEIPSYAGEKTQVVDAWATYLWAINSKEWVLGAN